MFQIEKFNKDGVEGVKVSFKFTAQNNTNGVNFNPLSVFTADAVKSAKLDLNHDFNYEKFDSSKTTWELKESSIKGTEVEHEVFMESTDPSTVEVVTSDDFRGFSANLIPKVAPVPNKKATPRYYPDGGILLESFTALTKGSPAFKGADKVLVETFSDESGTGVSIIEEVEIETPNTDEPEPKSEPKESQDKEKFYSYASVGEWVKIVGGQGMGKVTKIEQLEGGVINLTIKKTDGTEIIVSTNQNDQVRATEYIGISDIMDMIMESKGFEAFNQTSPVVQSDDDAAVKQKEDEEEQKRLEKLNKNAKEAFQMKELSKVEEFSKQDAVGDKPKTDENILVSAFKKLTFK